MSSRRAVPVPVLLLVLLLAGVLGGCSGSAKADPLRRAADDLAAALQSGQVGSITFSGDPGAARQYRALSEPLRGFSTHVRVASLTSTGDRGTARLSWVQTKDGATWKHDTTVSYAKQHGSWLPVWANSVLADGLEQTESLQVSSIEPRRGRILGAGGQPIVAPRPVVRFGIDKEQVVGGPAAAASAARRLAALVGVTPGPYVKQVAAAGPKAFVEAIVLRRADATQPILLGVAAIHGARAISDHLPLAPTRDFGTAILGTVGPVTAELVKASKGRLRAGDDAGLSGLELRYDEQLFGSRGLRISAVPATASNPGGRQRVLFEAPAVAGTDLRTTLDLRLEAAAQRLLANVGPASAVVAIRPSTGAILAAASGPGSNGYNTATFGQYAPGSTFKVVSSLALLRSGLTPSSVISCPTEVTVDGKRFTNYSDYSTAHYGRITLADAVAYSCNTAFVGQRARITGSALADAAAALGVGVDHDLGFPAYFGQVRPPASPTEAAADLIGQGRVLASPLAMAGVAASVVKGATVLPVLLPGQPAPTVPAPARPLTGSEATALRALMHAVVERGTGSFLQALQPPEVLAKTGTAEYGDKPPLPTHAWMIGARGDLAVAVFVATGVSGSHTAGPILEAFLRAAR